MSFYTIFYEHMWVVAKFDVTNVQGFSPIAMQTYLQQQFVEKVVNRGCVSCFSYLLNS